MLKHLHIIYFIAFFNTLIYSQAERTRFENYTITDGLLQNSIRCVFQDHTGFLWIGTEVGLSRYDGYKFTHYYFDPGDSNSISNPSINKIYEDSERNLWIGTNRGLNKYIRQLDSFKRYISDANNPKSISNNVVMCIYEDSKGIIWVGTDGGGLNRFDKNTETFTPYTHNPDDYSSISDNSIFDSICEDKNGNLLVGTFGGGLNIFNRDTQRFFHYTNDPQNSHSLSDNRIYKIYVDKAGTTWIGTEDGLNKVVIQNRKSNQLTFINYKHNSNDPNSLSSNRVYSICEDSNLDLLVATSDELNKFKRDQNIFIRYDIKLAQNIYQDQTGIIWIGTQSYGLFKLDYKKQQIKLFRNDPVNPNSLSNNIIYSFLEFNEKVIWVGTRDGLNIFNKETEDFIHFYSYEQNPAGLSDNNIYEIFRDRLGDFWIGTMKGLDRVKLNYQNSLPVSFIHYKNDKSNPSSICGNNITTMYEDKLGLLWIGTEYDGISILKRGINGVLSKNFSHFKNDPQDSNSICSNRIYKIYGDKSNNIWIGTINGLDLYNRELNYFSHFRFNIEDPTSLSSNEINSIYEDKAEALWVGTSFGLNKFDKLSRKFRRYTLKDGLPSNIIYTIIEDEQGNLWMGTQNGLSMFDPAKEKFNNYDVDDGLQSKEFNMNAVLKCSNGELLFGGVDGFNIFNPDKLSESNSHIPEIVITGFMLNNKYVPIGYDTLLNRTILSKAITYTEEITLSYNDNFSFEFSALDFTTPSKNKYAYTMEGFENNWNYTDAGRRFATYTNLNPGEYTFRVKGSNNDGIWNEAGTSIKIIIPPPWWATNWSYLIYALILISLIYFTWKLQLRRVKNKHELELSKFEAEKMHEVDELKSRFFANISHEFRTPLTLIFGPAKNILGNTQEPDTKHNVSLIKRNAQRLLSLVNQLLDISKLESGSMKLETAPRDIVSLLKGYALSFASYAERKRIRHMFNSAEGEIIVYLDKDKFEKIIFNILSNAFKYTPEGGLVEVNVTKNVNYVDIKVSDTGIGIPSNRIDKIFDRFYQVDGGHTREHEGTGIGLSLTKELIELHKGKIEVESEPGKGSTFTVSLPLGKDHLRPEEICEADEEKEEGILYIEEEEDKSKLEGVGTEFIGKDSLPLLLVVEDNADVRTYIKQNLKTDYKILEAVDGEDGWNKSIEHLPDLVVSDVMMTRMDGFELCRKIKTDERTSHIPVILLTAKAAKEDKLVGFETGADEYLMKPFDTDELKSRAKNLIDQRKRLQEHFRKRGLIGIEQQKITSVDKKFLQKSIDIITKHISDSSFSVEMFAEELAISRSGLQKKIHSLIGETPGDLIRRIRLNKAAELIKYKFGNISEIALEIGYNNPTHFSQAFKRQFGITPSQFQQKNNNS